MDKYSLGKKIKEAEEFTDEEKSELLCLLRTHKRYGLVWEEKTEDVEERLRDELPVLREVRERAIISDDKEAPNHILIEGDNLEALTTLSYTHAGKIDVIYIDPPYNTGNKDFVYNDRYVDSEDSYRHSKWLSFMSNRLKIAKQLLSDKGVIFISIDDNELAQLKLLCDEVFKEYNFISVLHWKKKKQPSFLHGQVAGVMEYILVYARKRINVEKISLESPSDANTRIDNGSNSESVRCFPAGIRVKFDKNISVIKKGVYRNKTMSTEYLSDVYIKNGRTLNAFNALAQYRDSQERIDMFCKEDVLFITKNYGFRRDKLQEEKAKRKPISDLLLDWGDNQDSDVEMRNLFGDKVFAYPKPLQLVKNIIKSSSSNNNSTILDFFAGSGTTMHATMQLNAEDGGRRQCILVTNNENNICEEVTYERNKRVIQGYTTPKREAVEGLKGNNLRYYKTEFVSRNRTAGNMRRLTSLATDMLCIKENLYAEQSHFGKHKTRQGTFRHFAGGERSMLVVYREEAIEELVDELRGMQPATPVCVYVFSPSEDPWRGMFEDVMEKVGLCPLPQAIYNAYQRILPRRRDTVVYVKTTDSEGDEEPKERT